MVLEGGISLSACLLATELWLLTVTMNQNLHQDCTVGTNLESTCIDWWEGSVKRSRVRLWMAEGGGRLVEARPEPEVSLGVSSWVIKVCYQTTRFMRGGSFVGM